MSIPRQLRPFRHLFETNCTREFHTTPQRCESTSRRLTKALRIPPAPSFTSPSAATQDQIIYNPPSSAPNIHHTPLKFLPSSDPRRALYAKTAVVASETTTLAAASPIATTKTALATIAARIPQTASPILPPKSSLPPPVREPYEKRYHLGQEEIDEMRRLRAEDPAKWSRKALARKFDCSEFFVTTMCKNGDAAREDRKRRELAKEKMGRGRREAREDRVKRKAHWGREA